MEKYSAKSRVSLLRLVALVLVFVPGLAGALEGRLSLDNDRYVVGQKFTLEIMVNSPDPLQVKLTQPTYPSSLTLSEGPSIRESSWEDSPGRLLKGTRISLSFKVTQSGLASLGPFVVNVGAASLLLPAKALYLLGSDEAKRRFPLEVRWQVPQGNFYQGQDIPVLLQVRNLDSLVKPADLSVPAPPGALWEKVVGLGEIEITSVGEDRIMHIPWGGWMLIPTQPGTLNLPSAAVEVSGVRRSAASQDLTILPLPPEAAASRAVGDLTYSADVSGPQDGQITVVQEIHGRGNFPYMVIPEVKVDGLAAASRQEGVNYRPTITGYQGTLTITTRFTADKVGVYNVRLPGFQSFQPENTKVWTWEPKTAYVEVTSLGGEKTLAKEKPLEPLTWDQVVNARPWGAFQTFWVWFLLLPGFLFWVFTFFQKKNRGKSLIVLLPLTLVGLMAAEPAPDQFQGAYESHKSGNYSVSMALWDNLLAQSPHEGGYWYNKGLAAAGSGQIALAEQCYRAALADGFRGNEVFTALKRLEDKEQLVSQHNVWQGPSLEFFFLLTIIGFNLFFLLWAVQRITGRAPFIIAAVIALLGTAGCGGLSAYILWERNQVDAVVGLSDGPIKRVPGDLAEEWMTLKRGTSVKALGATGEFVLVQTGYGLEGWVRKSYLLPIPK